MARAAAGCIPGSGTRPRSSPAPIGPCASRARTPRRSTGPSILPALPSRAGRHVRIFRSIVSRRPDAISEGLSSKRLQRVAQDLLQRQADVRIQARGRARRACPVPLQARQPGLSVRRQVHDALAAVRAWLELHPFRLRQGADGLAHRRVADAHVAGDVLDAAGPVARQRADHGRVARLVVQAGRDIGLRDRGIQLLQQRPQQRAQRGVGNCHAAERYVSTYTLSIRYKEPAMGHALLLAALLAGGCPEQQEVLEQVADAIERRYVTADEARQVAGAVRGWSATGRHADACGDWPAFIARLNRDLDAYDGHFHVERLLAEKAGGDDDWLMAWRAAGIPTNMGVREVRVFEGNVGYLRLASFYPWDMAGPKIRNALELVEETQGLVVDLRGNGGGDDQTAGQLVRAFLGDDLDAVQHIQAR